jgi:UDP-N-acetylmuramoylalanine--D-glutamate ligase
VENAATGRTAALLIALVLARKTCGILVRPLAEARFQGALERAVSMQEAAALARRLTPPGGVVLLSPAAPSYGQYRDFIERGRDFAAKIGLAGR